MKWSKKEVEFLRENYSKEIPLERISHEMNRTLKSIKRKSQNIGLHRPWIRFNKPLFKQSRKVIDRRYYENNKKKVYLRKMNRRKRLKAEAINLLGGKCKICGYNKCPDALDFH